MNEEIPEIASELERICVERVKHAVRAMSELVIQCELECSNRTADAIIATHNALLLVIANQLMTIKSLIMNNEIEKAISELDKLLVALQKR